MSKIKRYLTGVGVRNKRIFLMMIALERGRERVMKATPAICGDHLVPISECNCLDYLREIESSAKRLIQLAKERKELSK
jgi:hypothetical protein